MKWEGMHAQFYGITQRGKTTRALKWLMSQDDGLKIFIDTKAETLTKRNFKKYFDFVAPLSDIGLIIDNFDYFFKLKAKIALVPDNIHLDREMKHFCEVIWTFKRNNLFKVICLIDEIQEFSCWKQIRGLFVQGAGKNLFMGLTSQGWSQVKKNVRNNCELTVLCTMRKNDIEAMMDQGYLPYDVAENGHRIPKLEFKKKYDAFCEIGTGGKFVKMN